ncbi:desulfoferrodoxin [Syntrophobotulus glycolicus DSM 8271]|uniref:Desulfoferrodoxin n=1 Tax=Syntrophobotulus glycolicus (strain DSM 8271 / FlGlyR) TaxID=645991 RepID=F0T0E1_SYNGF|nr:desulfoferrodoxin [Syntrophobotulus glycolicus]ADY57313.1 desulfoferrodoxin [Syntrophobotulus glycolicus DSM 8271]
MTKLRQIYKCNICGNVIEVVHPGAPALVCCGQPMELLVGNTVDASKEKHVPVIEAAENGIRVQVGSVEHPMEEKHFIQFIEVLTADKVYRAELAPGLKPEAWFPVKQEDILEVREYCNIHGLWKTNE